ncbi:MAG: glycine zipper 2TM domain-containing protein [Pseudomonadota bacterium]|nr:glycine zipper 2TM domain-containing protein [Pseudomonadota bacterium]
MNHIYFELFVLIISSIAVFAAPHCPHKIDNCLNVFGMVGLFMLSTFVSPAQAADIIDQAAVVSSSPVYQTVVGQECYNVPVRAKVQNHSMVGSIFGGVVGALVGSQVGQGNGKVAAGAAGAIAGAITGDRLQNNSSNTSTGMQQQCQNVQKRVITGYRVTYVYNGKRGTALMQSPPGQTIQVKISAF